MYYAVSILERLTTSCIFNFYVILKELNCANKNIAFCFYHTWLKRHVHYLTNGPECTCILMYVNKQRLYYEKSYNMCISWTKNTTHWILQGPHKSQRYTGSSQIVFLKNVLSFRTTKGDLFRCIVTFVDIWAHTPNHQYLSHLGTLFMIILYVPIVQRFS